MKVKPVRDREILLWQYKYDHPVCEVCHRRPTAQLHHVVYRSQGGRDESCNLLATCLRCHGAIHTGDRHYNLTLAEVLSVKRETGDWEPERLEWMRRFGLKGLPKLQPIPEWVKQERTRR